MSVAHSDIKFRKRMWSSWPWDMASTDVVPWLEVIGGLNSLIIAQ